MERYVMADFPVEVSFEEVREKLLLEEEDDIRLMEEKFAQAKQIARPKAVYRVSYVDEKQGEDVVIDGVSFQSATLAKNLDDIHRVFAYIVTCGCEVDDWSHQEPDYVVGLWLDIVKEMILMDARSQFVDYLRDTYSIEKLSSINPGSGNANVWPIQQQRPLFELIGNVQEDIGVVLSPGFLMTPTKTVSGILFPSDKEYVNCAMCTRENCPGRKAPPDPELLKTLANA